MSKIVTPSGDLNQTRLAELIAGEANLPRDEAERALRAALDIIGRHVAAGYRVRLTNFGSWIQRTHKIGAGALGGRVTKATKVQTVHFHVNGLLRDLVRAGRPVSTLKKAPKSY